MSGKSKRPEWWCIVGALLPAVTAIVITLAVLYLVYMVESVDFDWLWLTD